MNSGFLAQEPRDFQTAPAGLRERWSVLAIALFAMTSFGVFRERNLDELWTAGGIDAQALYQLIVWGGLGVVAWALIVKRRADFRLMSSGPLFWYASYATLAVLSTIYSPVPGYTAYRSYQAIVGLILILSLREYHKNLLLLIYIWVGLSWLFVALGYLGLDGGVQWIRGPNDVYITYEGTATEAWRFASAFGHAANLSIVTAIAVIALASSLSRLNWRSTIVPLLWLGLTNVLTGGRVGLMSMLAGLAVVAVGRRILFPVACVLLLIIPIALISDNVSGQVLKYWERGQSPEMVESGGGRSYVYERALELAEHAPIYGYGFRSGRAQVYLELGKAVHAHNAFLEAYIGLGVLGLFVVIATLLSALRRAVGFLTRRRSGPMSRDLGWQYLALLVPIVAFSFSETGLAGEAGIAQLTFLAVLARFEMAWQASGQYRFAPAYREDFQQKRTQFPGVVLQ